MMMACIGFNRIAYNHVAARIPDAERQATRIAVERDEFHLFAFFEGARSLLVAVLGADFEQVQFTAATHVRVHLRIGSHME